MENRLDVGLRGECLCKWRVHLIASSKCFSWNKFFWQRQITTLTYDFLKNENRTWSKLLSSASYTSSSMEDSNPEYAKLRAILEEAPGSLLPSGVDYQSFVKAFKNSEHEFVEHQLKSWCTNVSDIKDFLALINFLQNIINQHSSGDPIMKDGIRLAIFKGIWHAFYATVAHFCENPPDCTFGELITAATDVTNAVKICLSVVLPCVLSSQTENNLCASIAKTWSHLSNNARFNKKLMNSLPWRDIDVCLTQKLANMWTYTQSDEIQHAFLACQLQFHESLPVNQKVLNEWSVLQANKKDFQRNFEACIASLDTAKGVEKNLTNLLFNFKLIVEDFDQQVPAVNSKPKKVTNKDKAYGQLEMMNDIRSLRRVLHYLSLAKSFSPDPEDDDSGFLHILLIERTLQVTGESVKNTEGSPNLSVKKRKALEKAKVPLETLSSLRNALSHYNCFSVERKLHVESAINVKLVLHELEKLEVVFAKALHRIEFTLFLELVGELMQTYENDSAEAQFMLSLRGCQSFAQIEEKMCGRMTDDNVRRLHFLIQQFDIQSKICKMEALFSSTKNVDKNRENDTGLWQELSIEKGHVAKSTLTEISEINNIEELLQDLSVPTSKTKSSDGMNCSSAKTKASNGDFLDKFIDAVAHKYMSREFYANVAQELLLGTEFRVEPVVIETLLDTYGDTEFATTEDKVHAMSALMLLDVVLHLKSLNMDTGSNTFLNSKNSKETLDCLSDLVANAHFQPVTEKQVVDICKDIGVDDNDVNFVVRVILQDMFESISDETNHEIYNIAEKVINSCCSSKGKEQVHQTKEDPTLKAARLKLISHIKDIENKKKGTLSEVEFNSCKAIVNDALTLAKKGNVQSLFNCSNGRFRQSDLKLLNNAVSSFENLCKSLKETKSLKEAVTAFNDYLANMDMSPEEKNAALSCFRSIQQDSLESFIVLRIKHLKKLLEKYDIPVLFELNSGTFAMYKSNHYLRAAIEMLLLECLEILDNLYLPSCSQTGSELSNFTLCETISSTDLRNYLAHGNSLLDFYDSDICHTILENAIELISNGECIMALQKLFEDAGLYNFIRCAEEVNMLHTVHVSTLTPLTNRNVQSIVSTFQSNPNWESIIKRYFKTSARSKNVHGPCKLTSIVNCSLTLSTKLMAEDALNLMLRNHLNQFSVLVRVNQLICKHIFRTSWTLLHYAMTLKQNAIDAVDILLESEANLNATDDRNLTPLHLAVLFEFEDGVDKLLSCKNIKVDAQNVYGVTALHMAGQQGSRNITQLLLNNKANPNIQSHNKWSALHFAVNYGHRSIVHLLLQAGANPNIVGENKWTPLHLAAYQNRVDIMKILLNQAADAYATLVDDPWHASRGVIHLAASYGNPDCIKLLLDRGVAIDLRCPSYKYGIERNPLHFAVTLGKEENVKFLLSHSDVDKDSADEKGCTAIDYAIMHKYPSLVTILLQHGCKLNLKAIIDVAAQGNLEMLQLLHEKGADLNASIHSFFHLTPSIAACTAGKLDVLQFLLKAAKPNIDAIMHTACMFGRRSIVQHLIEENYFPDPTRRFQDRPETPMHTAASYGRLTLVTYFVDVLGLSIDFSDGDGNTSCILAARMRKWAVVSYCLKHGADVTGEWGGQMARIAACNEQWALAQELYEKGASLDMHWNDSKLDENMAVVVTAACKGHLGMLEYLFEKQHLDVNTLPLQPLLVLLAAHAKRNVLHYLTTKGLAMTSTCDENSATGLHQAAIAGNSDACTFFLEDVNIPIDKEDANGCSALHYAIKGQQLHVVKYLLYRKADANIKNLSGQSPLMLALEIGNCNIIDCLAQRGDLLAQEFPDVEGNSFLMCLVNSVKDVPSAKFLSWLDHASTDIFHKNIARETILHLTAQIRNSNANMFLTLNKAKLITTDFTFVDFLNAKNRNGNSALMLVVVTSLDLEVVNVVEMLLKYNPDLNVRNCHQQTVLHLAIQRKNAEVLGALLEPLSRFMNSAGKSGMNLADPRLQDSHGLTPLELAKQLENKECVGRMLYYEHHYKLFVLKDEEVLAKNEAAKAAYYASLASKYLRFDAALMRDLQRVKSWVKENPNFPNLRDTNGDPAFVLAAEGGNTEVLECLVSAGSEVSAVNKHGQNALHVAAAHGHVAAVDYLIGTVGLGCHELDKEGNKPIHCATRSGMVKVLQYFFDKGLSDVDDLDANNETCLEIAAAAGRNEVIEYLLTQYHPDTFPLGNCSILNEAVFNENLSTVQLLLNHGVLPDIIKAGLGGKKSPFYLAIKNEYWPIAKLLLESATPEQLKVFLGDKGPDLLISAAGACSLEVVVLLVEKAGLDPNAPVGRGQTPLMSACCLGKADVVLYLLSKNASPNAFHHATKITALHEAARFGRLEAARLLIDHHADILTEDYGHHTPVHTAIKYSRWDVAVYILSRAGRPAKELFEKLPILHQEELKRHAAAQGIIIAFV